MGQKQTGETINTNIGVNANTGQYVFTFNDPFNMLINCNNSSSVIVSGSTHNDKFNLLNATDLSISGGKGNNIYNVGAAAGGLNGNVIKGNTAYDFVTLSGANTNIDLTQGSSGIEAVIGNKNFGNQTVTVNLSQLTASAATNGGTGRAFAAVIGTDGHVDVVQSGKFKFVGVIDAANHGFDANGNALTGDALTALQGSVTSVASITGNLASIYAGSTTGAVPANESEVSTKLNAYVFSDGTKSYTVWTDGTVSPIDVKGNALPDIFHPTAATPATPVTYNSVDVFNKTDQWAGATLFSNANGEQDIRLIHGNTEGYTAINLRQGVTGASIHGDDGNNGTNYFGLGQTGGSNHIFGSKAGNVFDLQTSTSLQDWLTGGKGFDVVRATADGADVDLTANNASGHAATSIDAVVGALNSKLIQNVEVDVTKLTQTIAANGDKTLVFEALLGSSDDTVHLTGGGKWVQVAAFAPGSALPDHASALVGADVLDAQFGSKVHTAENSLTGYLFEQVDLKGNPVKYLTVYTDATIDNQLTAPTSLHALATHDYLV